MEKTVSEEKSHTSPTHTREQVAKLSGVGVGTVARYNAVMKSDDKILKDFIETNIRQRGDVGGSAKKVGLRIKELERLYGIQNGSAHFQGNQHKEVVTNKSEAPTFTQEQLASQMGMSVDTLQNYKLLAEMIPELEELLKRFSKLRALISNNFGRRKNDPSKDRKALETYVSLRGYKNGELGNGRKKECQDGIAKLTLDEIAKELNMSKRNLQRALRIERNLTNSMKEFT